MKQWYALYVFLYSYGIKEKCSALQGISMPVNFTARPLSIPMDETGPRLNIKTVLSTYGYFHVKDKTAVRTSYL